jgi:hypothetical protein
VYGGRKGCGTHGGQVATLRVFPDLPKARAVLPIAGAKLLWRPVHTAITGFHQDEQEDWVADLSCGHGLHMRHNPPWLVREWVLTAAGRQAFIGRIVKCTKCLTIEHAASLSDGES